MWRSREGENRHARTGSSFECLATFVSFNSVLRWLRLILKSATDVRVPRSGRRRRHVEKGEYFNEEHRFARHRRVWDFSHRPGGPIGCRSVPPHDAEGSSRVLLVVLLGGGGVYGSRAGWGGPHYGGLLGLVLVILLVLWLTGNLGGGPVIR